MHPGTLIKFVRDFELRFEEIIEAVRKIFSGNVPVKYHPVSLLFLPSVRGELNSPNVET